MMQLATKRWFFVSTLFLFMTVAAFAGVSVSSPAAGGSTSSPVHFAASASGSSPISAMRIYVDSSSAYLVSAGSLNTNISMGNGSHAISVQAWDTQGHVYVSNFSINVGGSNVPSGSGTTFSLIEQMGGWQSCTTCAGAGGNGPSAAFWTRQFVGSPSQNGKSMQFFLGGSHPYSDALWWKQLGANNGATHFQYDVDFYLTSPQDAQALEFDVNQSNGARKFIFGTQCNIRGGGVWDVWNTSSHRWVSTGVGCSMPSAFTWHHLTWEIYRDSSSTHFVAVTLDGVKHFVNIAGGSEASGAHEINVAFQMDGDFAQHNYSAWLNFVTLRYW
jgi:hypothetical protein